CIPRRPIPTLLPYTTLFRSPVVSVSKASDLRFLRTKSANDFRSFSFSTTRIVFGPYRRVFIMPPLPRADRGRDSPVNRGCPINTIYLLLFHTGLHPDSRPAGQNHPDQLPRALVLALEMRGPWGQVGASIPGGAA